MAFQFSDDRIPAIPKYLTKREGLGFSFHEYSIELNDGDFLVAIVPFDEGGILCYQDKVHLLANDVRRASGYIGLCFDYAEEIVKQLNEMGIDGPALTELWKQLVQQT